MPAWRWEPAYLMKLARGIGQSQAILDLYRLPAELRTPWFVGRRAIYTGRLGLAQKYHAWRAREENERMAARMKAEHFLTQARTALGLCFHLPRI